jgi:hypothetical protein
MIYYLNTGRGDHTFRGNAILDDPRLADRFEVVTYDEAYLRRHWRGGAMIFADLDRLSWGEALRATVLYRRLRLSHGPIRLLNHPTRTCRRYALLRRLHDEGVNEYDVYRVDEGRRPNRYPVFIRSEQRHDGAYTRLIEDEETLDREIFWLTSLGLLPQDLLIVEFCDTADSDGIYRMGTAYIVGDLLFQRYMFFSDFWEAKAPRHGGVAQKRAEQPMLDEETAFIGGEQFMPQLRRVAEIGGFGFGRIDFGMKDGRAEIWEVNTNPIPTVGQFANQVTERGKWIVPFGWQQLRDALVTLDDDTAHMTDIEIEPPPDTPTWYTWFRQDVRQRTGKSA